MSRLLTATLMGAALLVPVTIGPTALRADDHKVYHDKRYNKDHEWDEREDKAYHAWVKERHRKYVEFEKLKDRDRDSYWTWRHDHPDEKLDRH